MKKWIALATVMMGIAAMAVSSSNMFGILRVDSTAEETIISVPWIETAASSGDIKICDLVLTSNLTVGDRLLYYTGTKPCSELMLTELPKPGTTTPAQDFQYLAWTLGTDADGVKVWESVTTVDKDADGRTRMTVSAPGGNEAVPRGAALMIIRPKAHVDPIYLYGQYTPGAVEGKALQGTFEQPAYTLLAPSDPNGVDLNTSGVMSGTPDINDYIVIGDVGTMLKYDNGQWGVMGKYDRTTGTYPMDTSKAVIKPGQGVWYVSRGGAPTFTW